ncbi:isomerase [Phragmitibacter flavus]|uniref:Isomerase n=1 Tax=Phragmitibacter flavus TaxID=2576071 RepID=A0A5R8KDX2_9BACT|nr:WxcM-like domain-containing protein [Phragmitibacter flavus]TLD70502.1 isomerase [Phragmitibacter flavus]
MSERLISISPAASIVPDVQIGPFVVVDAGAVLNAGVILEGGTRIWSGMVVEEGVRMGYQATLVGSATGGSSRTRLRRGCRIGANATVEEDLVIGEEAVVEPGAVVKQDVPPFAIVAGNPASVVGFVSTGQNGLCDAARESAAGVQVTESRVRGVLFYQMPFIGDPRGNLTVGEFGTQLPFVPKRYFMTFKVPSAKVRGEHAHRQCSQFLVCVHGSCSVMVDDGLRREEFLLDRPTSGVLVPPMTWAVEYKHSADSALMVFASEHYDPGDYIRSYEEFLCELRARRDRDVAAVSLET